MKEYASLEDRFSLPLFARRGLTLVQGKHAQVWDDQGRVYIDCVAGHGVVNIGHANPVVAKAIARQAETLLSCSGSFYNDQRALLLAKLAQITPEGLSRTFLCNSGAEAIEAALKFARFTTQKTDFICAMRGFHGRTMGALSATFNARYKEDFEPLVQGFSFVPFNNFERLQQAVTKRTAGILLEVVQGEGGVHIANPDYLKTVQEFCRQNDILLIIDEVQTGFGRTGKMFACQHYNLKPDILCLAKGIAGGVPMGAVVCSDRIKIGAGKHGSTFGGNPLACAAARATIDFIEQNDLPQQAFEKGLFLRNRLEEINLSKVREIRQIGLMIGIELKEKARPYIQALQKRGILTIAAGPTVIRLLPPLTIEHELLEKIAANLCELLR